MAHIRQATQGRNVTDRRIGNAPNFVFVHAYGPIIGWFSEGGLQQLHLPRLDREEAHPTVVASDAPVARALKAALARYFQGQAEDFGDVPLDLTGATDFQRTVWEAAREIPYGSTSTYGQLAERIGHGKTAARAVGHALGQNPIAVVIPCHRFVAANGHLTGYAGGIEWKRELLRIERTALC
jgi:methylated-DNA-[protein]-cysteine S-methyltransferase